MEFQYISPRRPWQLDPGELRHPYFVQTVEDKLHLVTGMLTQGARPRSGNWLKIGTIRKKLAHRYFVQQTSFNTLVPGSLVQTDEPPGDSWKDVQTYDLFHLFYFFNPYLVLDIEEETTFDTAANFITEMVTPALNEVYPGRDPNAPITLKLYYTTEDYTTIQDDPSLLIPFASGDNLIGYYLTDSGTYVDSFESNTTEPANLTMKPEAPLNSYSIVLEVVDPGNQIRNYIYLNSIVNHRLPA